MAAVIAKLPASWNNYRKKLLHTSEDFTIDQLIKHIRIEEETRFREKKLTSGSEYKVNNVESKKSGNNKKNKRKYSDTNNDTSANMNKKNKSYFHCGKKGHFKKECMFYKKVKTEAYATQKNVANVVENKSSN